MAPRSMRQTGSQRRLGGNLRNFLSRYVVVSLIFTLLDSFQPSVFRTTALSCFINFHYHTAFVQDGIILTFITSNLQTVLPFFDNQTDWTSSNNSLVSPFLVSSSNLKPHMRLMSILDLNISKSWSCCIARVSFLWFQKNFREP